MSQATMKQNNENVNGQNVVPPTTIPKNNGMVSTGGSIFGTGNPFETAPSSGGSIFGAGSASSATGASIFGSGSASNATGTSIFGAAQPSSTTTGTSIFGRGPPPASSTAGESLFGGAQSASVGNPQPHLGDQEYDELFRQAEHNAPDLAFRLFPETDEHGVTRQKLAFYQEQMRNRTPPRTMPSIPSTATGGSIFDAPPPASTTTSDSIGTSIFGGAPPAASTTTANGIFDAPQAGGESIFGGAPPVESNAVGESIFGGPPPPAQPVADPGTAAGAPPPRPASTIFGDQTAPTGGFFANIFPPTTPVEIRLNESGLPVCLFQGCGRSLNLVTGGYPNQSTYVVGGKAVMSHHSWSCSVCRNHFSYDNNIPRWYCCKEHDVDICQQCMQKKADELSEGGQKRKCQEALTSEPLKLHYTLGLGFNERVDHDFVWAAIQAGDVNVLKNFCPPDFDFMLFDPRKATKGLTPLHLLLTNFLFDSLMHPSQEQKYYDTCKWLLEHGADPSQSASEICVVCSILPIPVLKLGDPVKTPTKVFHNCRTAVASVLHMRMTADQTHKDVLLAEHGQSTREHHDLYREYFGGVLERCDEITKLFTQHSAGSTKPTKSLMISEDVVDVWERFLQDGDARDVTIDAKNADQSIKVHGDFLTKASPVMKIMLNGAFSETNTKMISVDEKLAPNTLNLFVDLLYCGSSNMEERPCATVLDVFDLAHRWQIQYVCDICERWLVEMMNTTNIESITKIALMKNIASLELSCRRYVESNMESFVDMPSVLQDLIKSGNSNDGDEPPKKKRRC